MRPRSGPFPCVWRTTRCKLRLISTKKQRIQLSGAHPQLSHFGTEQVLTFSASTISHSLPTLNLHRQTDTRADPDGGRLSAIGMDLCARYLPLLALHGWTRALHGQRWNPTITYQHATTSRRLRRAVQKSCVSAGCDGTFSSCSIG